MLSDKRELAGESRLMWRTCAASKIARAEALSGEPVASAEPGAGGGSIARQRLIKGGQDFAGFNGNVAGAYTPGFFVVDTRALTKAASAVVCPVQL